MYNCSVGQAPEYLKELLSKQTKNHKLRSSKNSESCYTVPLKRETFYSKRSFSTIGPKLWNKLPFHIEQSKSVDDFKSKLKNYFFRDCYVLFQF